MALYQSLQEIIDMNFSVIEVKLASLFLDIEKERRTVTIDVADTHFSRRFP